MAESKATQAGDGTCLPSIQGGCRTAQGSVLYKTAASYCNPLSGDEASEIEVSQVIEALVDGIEQKAGRGQT